MATARVRQRPVIIRPPMSVPAGRSRSIPIVASEEGLSYSRQTMKLPSSIKDSVFRTPLAMAVERSAMPIPLTVSAPGKSVARMPFEAKIASGTEPRSRTRDGSLMFSPSPVRPMPIPASVTAPSRRAIPIQTQNPPGRVPFASPVVPQAPATFGRRPVSGTEPPGRFARPSPVGVEPTKRVPFAGVGTATHERPMPAEPLRATFPEQQSRITPEPMTVATRPAPRPLGATAPVRPTSRPTVTATHQERPRATPLAIQTGRPVKAMPLQVATPENRAFAQSLRATPNSFRGSPGSLDVKSPERREYKFREPRVKDSITTESDVR